MTSEPSASRNRLVLVVYTAAIFVSALLLFSVQPLFTKMVLPRLGGSPAVWSVAMVFFQSLLLGGYAYAHLLMKLNSRIVPIVVHLVLLVVALLTLPLSIKSGWGEPPTSGYAVWLLGLFAVSIGLPFFALAANNPLLQAWFVRTGHPNGPDPYFLYASWNIGSFLALLSYPVLLEPMFTLRTQNLIWTGGYGLLIILVAGCGVLLLRSPAYAAALDTQVDDADAHPESPESVRAVSARHALPHLIARLLLNRGLAEAEEILAYLEPHLGRLTPPSVLPEVKVAAARLARAVRSRETVAVYGDYDADGLTATCLLQQFFRELGVPCVTYVPDRLSEGYGLNRPALQGLAKQAGLLVTVDCGVSDLEEVAWAGEQGMEVIVTDHHEIPPELPPALAVVNPKLAGARHPFAVLAGVGVALLLALGVRTELRESGWFKDHPEPNLRTYLDLVALGTAADIVPVVGERHPGKYRAVLSYV